MKNKSGYTSMWNERRKQIMDIVHSKFVKEYPVMDLLVEIFINEAQWLKNKSFFYSDIFIEMCRLMKLEALAIRRIMIGSIMVQEQGIKWDYLAERAAIKNAFSVDTSWLTGGTPENLE